MDDLATSLGISKRTIYENFESKEDILKNCMHTSQENIHCKMVQIMDQSDNIIDGFLQIINHFKYVQLPNGLFWNDIYKYYPEVYQFVVEDIEKTNIYIKGLVKEGIQENYFRKHVNFDEVISTCIIVGNIYSAGISISRTDILSSLMINMLRGISTYKGIEIIDKYIDNLPHSNN